METETWDTAQVNGSGGCMEDADGIRSRWPSCVGGIPTTTSARFDFGSPRGGSTRRRCGRRSAGAPMTDIDELAATLAAVARALEALGVSWAVGGSVASSSAPETTQRGRNESPARVSL